MPAPGDVAARRGDVGSAPAGRRLRCVASDESSRDLPLEAHDLAAIPLELADRRAGQPELLAGTEKPSKTILEGFYRERVPARGGCGRRG